MIKDHLSKECKGTLIQTKNHYKLIQKGLNGRKFKLEKIMTGSKDGFSSEKFNELCVNQGPTLTVIQSHLDLLFGGFTSVNWRKETNSHSQDESAFIFSLTKNSIHRPYQNKDYTIFKCGILAFGGSPSDIYLNDNCNTGMSSHCNLGSTYSLPEGLIYGSEGAKSYLAGSYQFKVKDFEVFKVIF